MRKNTAITLLLLTVIVSAGCSSSRSSVTSTPSLKEAFKNHFLIGTALDSGEIDQVNKKTTEVITHHFNAVTPENVMKSLLIHPEPNRYDFTYADKLIDFARKQNMYVTGHTLVWHSQLSPFARNLSKEEMPAYLENHINTIAGRYAGKINSWDVINEALNEDGTLRKTVFLEKLGEDYIRRSFELAAKADPNAKLYYNDFNNEQPAKRAGTIALVKKLQASGTKIDGVGIQGHWHLGIVPFDDIEKSILEYAALGMEVAITELDINVLPRPNNMTGANVDMNAGPDPMMNPYVNGLPENIAQQLASDYEKLFQLLIKHSDKISRVTFWGVNDDQSWLNSWPIPGRTNYPLLFDRNYEPKEAFRKVIALVK